MAILTTKRLEITFNPLFCMWVDYHLPYYMSVLACLLHVNIMYNPHEIRVMKHIRDHIIHVIDIYLLIIIKVKITVLKIIE